MSTLIDDQGNAIYNPRDILENQRYFYENLYKKDENIVFDYTLQNKTPQVPEHMKESLRKEISEQEVINAIKGMARNKTPGSDGLPVEFYIVFWEQIRSLLMNAISAAFCEKRLHDTAREGIITLIPKKNKDCRYVQNMRPITLLNVDYKIIEKVLANRIKPVLFEVIHDNQKGFMKGRHISVNIRKVLDLMSLIENSGEPGIVLQIDFEKAFDRCHIPSLLQTLKIFGFPQEYVQWIEILYQGAHSKVVNKGYLSNYFEVSRSVKQGGPNSAFLFLLLAEIFAICLRENKKIQGFTFVQIKEFLNQFADDTDLLLHGTQQCIDEVFKTIRYFESISGMKINYNKTTLFRIGSLANSEAKFYVERNVNWQNDPANVLGVEITHDKRELLSKNIDMLLDRTAALLNVWKRRNLSLIAKTIVINTLTASLFVYKMSVLPAIPQEMIDKYEKIISDFMWNGRKPKINIHRLKLDKKRGGLNLVDLKVKDDSLKAAWVRNVSEDKFLRAMAFQQLDPNMQEFIFRCNLKESDIKSIFTDSFWRDVLLAWSKVNYLENPDKNEVLSQFIWYNSRIRQANKIFKSKKAIKNGLLRIVDLIDENLQIFLSPEAIVEKYNIDIMLANAIITAIPTEWKKLAIEPDAFPAITMYEKFYLHPHPTRYYYTLRNQAKPSNLHSTYTKWQTRLHSDCTFKDYLKMFREIYLITNHTKLRSFQYRLLSNAVVTNQYLKFCGITDSELCTFCQKEPETLVHLFCECPHIENIWLRVNSYAQKLFPRDQFSFSRENLIFNRVAKDPKHVINFMVLAIKSKIYTQRCLKQIPEVTQMFNFVNECKSIEKYNAMASGKMMLFIQKWEKPSQNATIQENNYLSFEEYAEQYIDQISYFDLH